MRTLIITGVLLAAASSFAADFPQAEISNQSVTAKLYLPDADKGYYRATRFDWSGQIYSLKADGHEYFGQWFPKYDPKLHDSIMGPVEEFSPGDGGPGYAEAQPGGTFIRIGVGVVRKPANGAYGRYQTYEIVDPGKRSVKQGRNWIRFTHEIRDANGYGYRYTKTIRLLKSQPVMVIEHTIDNIGRKPIRSEQYSHNFFVMDNSPTGPESVVTFPFELKPLVPFRGDAAKLEGKRIVYTRELRPGESVYGEFGGFGQTAADYDFHAENRRAGVGVEIRGDQPLAKLVYWSPRTTFCPEAYISINADPGHKFAWKYTYRFYKL